MSFEEAYEVFTKSEYGNGYKELSIRDLVDYYLITILDDEYIRNRDTFDGYYTINKKTKDIGWEPIIEVSDLVEAYGFDGINDLEGKVLNG